MARRYKPTSKKLWTQAALKNALAEHKELGTSLRDLSKKHNIPKSTLANHITGGGTKKVGRKAVFSPAELEELKQTIVDMAELGFAMTVSDIGEVVESYVAYNEHDKARVSK